VLASLTLGIVSIAGIAGCQSGSLLAGIQPTSEVELGKRAYDLLKRAAESDLDVVRAHVIEALVQIAP
jgi:hypothetical protein